MWNSRVNFYKFLFKLNFSYIAPEMFGSKGYTEKVDIYSAGIILFTL